MPPATQTTTTRATPGHFAAAHSPIGRSPTGRVPTGRSPPARPLAAATPLSLAPHAWKMLTDAEYATLRHFLPPAATGRPAADLRRTLDAVFWVACSAGPWKDLPEALGKPGSAHRALSRWARAGALDRLLLALARGAKGLASLAFRLCRAFRRMARLVPLAAVARVKALGLKPAWPQRQLWLPAPGLSERLQRLQGNSAAGLHALQPRAAGTADALEQACRHLLRLAERFRRGWRLK